MPTSVSTLAELQSAADDTGVSDILLTANIEFTSPLAITRSDLTIDFGNKTLTLDCTSAGKDAIAFTSTAVDSGFVGIGQAGSPSRGSSLVTGTITAAGTTLQMHDEVVTLTAGDIVSIQAGVNTGDPAEPYWIFVRTVASVTGPVSGTYTITFTEAFGVDVPTYSDADDLKSHVASAYWYKIQPTGSYGQWYNNDGTLATSPWSGQANYTKGLGTSHGLTRFVGGAMNRNVTIKNGVLHTLMPSDPSFASGFPVFALDVFGFTVQNWTWNNVFGSCLHSVRSHQQTVTTFTITGTGLASFGSSNTTYANGFSSWGGTSQVYEHGTWDNTTNINGFNFEIQESDLTIDDLIFDGFEFDPTGIDNTSDAFVFGLPTVNSPLEVSNIVFTTSSGDITWSEYGQVTNYRNITFANNPLPVTLFIGDGTEIWTDGGITIGGETYGPAVTVSKTSGSAITVTANDGSYNWIRMPRGIYLSQRLRLTTVGSCVDIYDPLGNHYSTAVNTWTNSRDASAGHSWGTLQKGHLWSDYEDGTHGIALQFVGSSQAVIEVEITYLPLVGADTARDWQIVPALFLTIAQDMSLPTTNLTAHFDASATANLKKTIGGSLSASTGTPIDGDPVEAWLKESDGSADIGLGWNASNVESPNFRSGGSALMLNSCLDFDGTNDRLTATKNDFSGVGFTTNCITTAAHTILLAIYPESITLAGPNENNGHIIIGDAVNGYWGLNLCVESGTKKAFAYIYDGADRIISLPITDGASHVIMWRHESGTQYLSVDGGTEVSGTAGAIGSATNAIVGGGGAALYNGRIGEIAVYNAALTGAALTDAINYFTSKWLFTAPIAGTLSETSHTSTSVNLSYATVTGGTPPYSNQLKRSTVSGSGYGNLASGSGAAVNFGDTGLDPATDYYYIVVTTDDNGQTATSNEVHVTTDSLASAGMMLVF